MIPVSAEVPLSGHGSPAYAAPTHADQIAQALAQDSRAVRFKKLLIYTCRGVWESDAACLEAVQFSDLILTLKAIAPTWQELQPCLLQSANRLNKAAEYMLVAHTLLGLMQPLYPDASPPLSADPKVYEAIAQTLTLDPDLLRLKKLLILACTNQWESDPARLEQAELPPLLHTLHALTLTRAGLCLLFGNLVKTLSKPAEYRLFADRLIQALQPLYRSNPPAAELPREASQETLRDSKSLVPGEAMLAEATIDLDLDQTPARSSAATKFSTIAEATAALSVLLDEQSRRSNSAAILTSNPASVPAVSQGLTGSGSARIAPALFPFALKPDERFHLRQSVVQASNPLRTKILLFSLLHESFQFQQHDSILKEHDLDDLLHMMLQSYPHAVDLESALHQAARQLTPYEAYLKSIHAVMQAVQRLRHQPSTLPGPALVAATAVQSTESAQTHPLGYVTAVTQQPAFPEE